jgi:hypothetical protein
MDVRELSWKQYEKHIELYKFYWEIVVKINTFHFVIAGAIISFYFSRSDVSGVQWALLLPALLSLCWAIVFGYGAAANLVTRKDIFALRDQLELQVAPEFMVLTVVLTIFTLAHIITAIALGYLMCTHGA